MSNYNPYITVAHIQVKDRDYCVHVSMNTETHCMHIFKYNDDCCSYDIFDNQQDATLFLDRELDPKK
jgi:hypothetical protein